MKKINDKKTKFATLTTGVGAALMMSALSVSPVQATDNPFATQELSQGFMLAGKSEEGKCGEAKCGGDKKNKEGKCGEGKCGEGKCGEDKKHEEGKCGEGKCGGTH